MRALSAAGAVELWERGHALSPARRALEVLRECTARPEEELEALPVGSRDRLLLEVRAASFGTDVQAVHACASCGATVEITLQVGELLDAAPLPGRSEPGEVSAAGLRIRFTSPTAGQLALAADAADPSVAAGILADGCLEVRGPDHGAVRPSELPGDVLAAVERAMAEADPLADIRLSLACPECGHRAEVELDVAALLWDEVASAAERVLREVDLLAWTYGWSEADILALSPARRRLYVEMASA